VLSALDFCRKGRIGGGTGAGCSAAYFSGLASRNAGLWVVGAPMWRFLEPTESTMTTPEARLTIPAKRAKSATPPKGVKKKAVGRQANAHAAPSEADPSKDIQAARVTKHDRVLTLLTRREGVTIPEMMEATDWQQHSVRGFLAGTVKKKLGFNLTSSKSEGELRRYRIETKRTR